MADWEEIVGLALSYAKLIHHIHITDEWCELFCITREHSRHLNYLVSFRLHGKLQIGKKLYHHDLAHLYVEMI